MMTLRTRLILGFAVVVLFTAAVSVVIGTRFIGTAILGQAQAEVDDDLAAGRLAYKTVQERVRSVTQLTAERFFLADAARSGALDGVAEELERLRVQYALDYLSMVDGAGVILVRSRDPYSSGDDQSSDLVVDRALRGEVVVSTEILSEERLTLEGSGLAERARTTVVATPHAVEQETQVERAGMVFHAGAPIRDADGRILGALYGGILLNRSDQLVDEIRDAVYGGKLYRGRDIGTATIFQEDVRIATNVTNAAGERAIGTRVSQAVFERVLMEGRPWNDRAFVVNEWYLTAYEPIRTNTDGRIVGMLYVGKLEQPFVDERNRVVASTVRNALVFSVGLALLTAFLLARQIRRPIQQVAEATDAISRGDFSQRVAASTGDEIGALASSFNRMADTLKRTLDEKDEANDRLRATNRRYLELLGFVTHELMGPLGVMRGYLTLMRDQRTGALAPDAQHQAVDAMLRSTERLTTMTKTYLDLSRIERGELRLEISPCNLYRDIIGPTVAEMELRWRQRDMSLELENEADMREAIIHADAALFRIVYTNLLDNAVKYGREGARIVCGYREEAESHLMNVWNEGMGIPSDKRAAVFEKFVRLVSASGEPSGTGLGLSSSRAIVERHGGTIWVESREGQWANFIIRLPKRPQPAGRLEEGKGAA